MRSILAAALFVLVALAGCADTGVEIDEETSGVDPARDGDNMGDEPAEAPVGPNTTVLMPVLAADIVNGTAPMLVNFTIDALNATDALNVTWSLDFGDGNSTDGTGVPAAANHTYGAGDFVATLTLVEGAQTTTSSANITALVGYVSGVLIETTEWIDSGSLVAGIQWCGLQDGIDYAEYTWDASALLAQDYAVSNIALVTTNGDTTVDIDLDFYAPDGTLIGHAGSFELPGGHETITGKGPYPAGEFVLQVSACSGVAMDFDWVMTADLVTA